MEKVKTILSSFDFFVVPVAPLNLRGQTAFKTVVGGILSNMIRALLISFAVVRFNLMIDKENTTVYQVG